MHLRNYQRIWRYFQQHRMASIIVGHLSVVAILGLLFLGSTVGPHIFGAFAQSSCSSSDHAYRVVRGDTLGSIATRNRTSWQQLASHNHIANANLIYVNQTICIPNGKQSSSTSNISPLAVKGKGNFFPYGQCTWWANQRYYQMHGIYVPWTTNSDAWAWSNRAHDFHWNVSSQPAVGDIVDLQPWVQGAYGLGHVGVVERVLSNGKVIASNMNWGADYWQVTDAEFSAGPGVTFISF